MLRPRPGRLLGRLEGHRLRSLQRLLVIHSLQSSVLSYRYQESLSPQDA